MSSVVVFDSSYYSYPKKEHNFRPSVDYPETPFREISAEKNTVYDSVRECFFLMGYDLENFNKSSWNPLGRIVSPGNTVLIKPNLVMHCNGNKIEGTDCLYTHPSIVAAVIDYVVIALGREKKGKIVVGDAPMQECDFEYLIESSGYLDLINYYKSKGIDIELVDFRGVKSVRKQGILHQSILCDAEGTVVNLGQDSEFYGDSNSIEKLRRITGYDPRILPKHHTGKIQEYMISNKVLTADVVINIPKPKTHRKAGVTIALKNMVGINVRKEYLPHHTMGAVLSGGDEYLNKDTIHAMRSKLYDLINILSVNKRYKLAKCVNFLIRICSYILRKRGNIYSEGSWYGNNTISRAIIDLNKILLYADKHGNMQNQQQRRVLTIGDMIISGEKEGPVCPSAKKVGIVAMGDNLVCFDRVICKLMGFDENKINTLNVAQNVNGRYYIGDHSEKISVISNNPKFNKELKMIDIKDTLKYIPTEGWKGHIELVE